MQSYAYGDLVRNSSDTDAKLGLGLHRNYSTYQLSVDFEAELTRIASTKFQSTYDFHQNLTALFAKFHDAHTLYHSPYTAISYSLPFSFGSVMVGGVQRVTVDRVLRATFPSYYQVHKGPPYINFDKFSSEYLAQYYDVPQPQNLISTINGVDALEYLKVQSCFLFLL